MVSLAFFSVQLLEGFNALAKHIPAGAVTAEYRAGTGLPEHDKSVGSCYLVPVSSARGEQSHRKSLKQARPEIGVDIKMPCDFGVATEQREVGC